MGTLRLILRLLGAVCVVVGIAPFTPIIWLLVFVRASPPWLSGVQLRFWQTEALGAALAVLGICLLWVSFMGRRSAR